MTSSCVSQGQLRPGSRIPFWEPLVTLALDFSNSWTHTHGGTERERVSLLEPSEGEAKTGGSIHKGAQTPKIRDDCVSEEGWRRPLAIPYLITFLMLC